MSPLLTWDKVQVERKGRAHVGVVAEVIARGSGVLCEEVVGPVGCT